MTTILTVDDSRAVRTIVTKQIRELGFDVEEAENGEEGLDRLEESHIDLVLLDVTMPVLDGPGMLRRMRERGDNTPVVMLTSEAKRSIVSEAMTLGIKGYILKPFKQDELRNKILSAVGVPAASAAPAPSGASVDKERSAASADASVVADGVTRQFIDVLVIDDMENVAKKLKSMLPPHVTLNSATNAQAAFQLCREKLFRVILVDEDMPDVDTKVLTGQVRVVQPHATMVALAVRSPTRPAVDWKERGFADFIEKPFAAENIEDFMMRHFDQQDILTIENDVMHAGKCTGKGERVERYFRRLDKMISDAMDNMAAACYEEIILDLEHAPRDVTSVVRVLGKALERAAVMRLSLRVSGPVEIQSVLAGFKETEKVTVFESIAAARSGEAA